MTEPSGGFLCLYYYDDDDYYYYDDEVLLALELVGVVRNPTLPIILGQSGSQTLPVKDVTG